jgi:hypothetical protein
LGRFSFERQKFFMKKIIILFTVLLNIFTTKVFSLENSLEIADNAYQKGECEKAISLYQNLSEGSLNQNQRDTVLFRKSYCHFSLDHYSEAAEGFKKYLSTHTNEDEARLKLSQALLYQDFFNEAKEVASKITSNDFKMDAAIVIARAEIEGENFKKALVTLNPFQNNSEAMYWMAVAEYRGDKDLEAEKKFKLAIQKAEKDSWVINESNSWLTRMNQEKQKFHFRLTAGLFHDSNIDQSGGSGTVNMGGPGGPGGQGNQGGPKMSKPQFLSANYTKDTGKYAAVDFIHNTYSSRKLYLTTTASFSSPFYSKYPSYNQESASLDLSLKSIYSKNLSFGASVKYLDTFYNKVYSQDYIYLTPNLSWSFLSDYTLKFSTPITTYLNSKKIKIYGGNVDLYYDPTNWLSVSLGGSTSKSTGPDALIVDQGSGPVLVSGTMFSHYTSTGAYLGLTFYFLDTYQFGVTGSSYSTDYEIEKIPGPQNHKARADKLKSYQFSFTKSFIRNVLSANLSYSHSDNTSDGFPGLASGGSVSNNSYKRAYTLLTLEYYY